MNKTHLTVKELGSLSRVSSKTIYRWIKSGRVHPIKPGGEYLVPVEEVRRLGFSVEGQ